MMKCSFWLKSISACALLGTLACGTGSGSDTGTGGASTGGQTGAAGTGGGSASGDAGTTGNGGSTGDAGTSGGGGSTATGTAGDASGGGGSGTTGTGGGVAGGGSAGTGAAGARGGNTGSAGRGGNTGTAGAAAGRGGNTGVAGAAGGRGGSAGSGVAGSGPGGQTACVGSAYDAASPPQLLTLSGSLGAHDPAALVVGNTINLFATGLTAKTSTNLTTWQNATNPLNPRPSWVADKVAGATNLWAPDISSFGGMYHLYYAASTFGSNKSCIGHATKTDIATGSWADQGTVICSNMGTSDNWNAIDPNIVIDDAGTPWMAFGSFWSGLKIIKLDATGARADTAAPTAIANGANGRGSLEGAWIFKNCGYYYLFSSWGACCDGAYDYNIRVGRSTSVTGPYVDKAGVNLMGSGGGTLLVQGNSTVHAPGHNAVITYNNKTYNLYHALNASNGNASLHIAEIAWDAQGWPISGGP